MGEPQTGEKVKKRKTRKYKRNRGETEELWSYVIIENDDKQKIVVYFAEFSFKPGQKTKLFFETVVKGVAC